ncbi:MAG: hypothetical protein ABSB75_02215 [Candidatus Limnocylindrales bacterium]
MTSDEHIEPVQMPLAYVGVDDAPIEFANQFAVQLGKDALILLVGQVAPPFVLGTADEQRDQLRNTPFVPVRILARYGITLAVSRELRDLLTRQIELYDKVKGTEVAE